jgi:hypothetical protein
MLGEIPFAEDVMALFKDHCCSDISITGLVPKAAV